MLTLVTGGSASGKSAYAEKLALSLPGDYPGIYLATMEPLGREAQERIERHRAMRKNRGFLTVECARNLRQAPLPPGGSVLLEDLGNLVANELFGDAREETAMGEDRFPNRTPACGTPSRDRTPACGTPSRDRRGKGDSVQGLGTGDGSADIQGSTPVCRILEDIEHVRRTSAHLTIVTNEVFSAGQRYEGDTLSYMRILACVNRALAKQADQVVEVVCGIPVFLLRKSGFESPEHPVFPEKRKSKISPLHREAESRKGLFDKRNEAGKFTAKRYEEEHFEAKQSESMKNLADAGFFTQVPVPRGVPGTCDPSEKSPSRISLQGAALASGMFGRGKVEKGDSSMLFVTGPLYAGKQAYVMRTLGWQEADFAQNAVRDVQELAAEAVRAVHGAQDPAAEAGREVLTQDSLSDTLSAGPGREPALEARLRMLADTLARKQVVIATEVGGGIVPLDPLERREREAAGRLACLLAARAQTVVRVNCGLPQVLKGPAEIVF